MVTLGSDAEKSLLGSIASIRFGGGAGDPVFSTTDAQLAITKTDEKKFDIFMTPFLTELFAPLTLVTSEDFRWIRLHEHAAASDQDGKPDFLIAPVEFVERRTPSAGTSLSAVRDATSDVLFRFGVPASWSLRDFVRVLESKAMALGNAEFGELILYLQKQGGDRRHTRGMLFNQTDFWLVEVKGHIVTQRIMGKWVQGGVKQLIRKFMHFNLVDTWCTPMAEICTNLEVRVMDPHVDNIAVAAFLGEGAFGRVFRVLSANVGARPRLKDLLALKVVDTSVKHEPLQLEFDRLRTHHDTCSNCTLLVRPVSTLSVSGSLAAYAMAPVGSALTRDVLRKPGGPGVDDVVRALQNLHVHAGGIVHGDPRLANLILVGQDLMWIDLVGSIIDVSHDGGRTFLFRRDACCLARHDTRRRTASRCR
jgi:hypothetical protein